MKRLAGSLISRIHETSEIDSLISQGLSFFDPYLQYYIRQTLETEGEVYVSRNASGNLAGLFIYDAFENVGTIFTRSKEVFRLFFELKPVAVVFSELKDDQQSETYDIYTVDLAGVDFVHRFSHEISVAGEGQADELRQFMVSTHPGINKNWVNVALKDGEKCLLVLLSNEIAGAGWLSLVNGIGRLHSLYVKPQFRRLRIGEDILFARLLWLKSKHARLAFSEIARENVQSARIALKGHMSISGQIYQYSKNEPVRRLQHERPETF